jgi:hypothetical protein
MSLGASDNCAGAAREGKAQLRLPTRVHPRLKLGIGVAKGQYTPEWVSWGKEELWLCKDLDASSSGQRSGVFWLKVPMRGARHSRWVMMDEGG